MLGRVVFVAVLGLCVALVGSFSLIDRLPAPAPTAAVARAAPTDASDAASATDASQQQTFTYRETLLKADARGQYAADALINGVPVRMLVDTGASDVVVSASTAARLGLRPSTGAERLIMTANGRSTAAPARLAQLSFGGLYMNDVAALVLKPEAGEVNLLGESFLKRLVSVEQRDGLLILRQ